MLRWESSGLVRPESAPGAPMLTLTSPWSPRSLLSVGTTARQGESPGAPGSGVEPAPRGLGACGHVTYTSGDCLTSYINTYSFDKANIRLFKNNFWKTPNRNTLSKTPSTCRGSRPSEPPVWGGGWWAAGHSSLSPPAASSSAHNILESLL